MPKPRPLATSGERSLTEAEWNRLTALYWEPYLAEMLALDSKLALKEDKAGGDARQRIYDRLVGKPVEVSRSEVASTITITVRPITSTEEERGGEGEELGVGVCENAMDRSIYHRKSTPTLPDPAATPPPLLSRGTLPSDPVPTPLTPQLAPDEVPPLAPGAFHPDTTPVVPELPFVPEEASASLHQPLPPPIVEMVPSVGVSPQIGTPLIDADSLPARSFPRRS